MIVHFRIAFSTRIIYRLLCGTVTTVWIVRSHYNSTSSFSMTSAGACSYHLSELSSPCFLHNSQWTIQATLSYLLLYCFCPSLGKSLTRCKTVSSFVPHNLHLGEIGCLSIFALIELVLSACSWASNNMPSVSFFKTPFVIHFPQNVCAMFLVFYKNCPCTFPSCKVFFHASLFLFVNSSFVSPFSITFSFSALLSISSFLSFR